MAVVVREAFPFSDDGRDRALPEAEEVLKAFIILGFG